MKNILQATAPVAVLLVVLILLIVFHTLPPEHSKGYFVRLAPARCPIEGFPDTNRLVVLRILNKDSLFINQDPVKRNDLELLMSEIYSSRANRVVYLLAEREVPLQTVVDTIDVVENTHYATAQGGENLGISIELITPAALNAPCPGPVAVGQMHRIDSVQ